MVTIRYHSPKDAPKFKNEYILYFSDEENPEVLFHTPLPEEAYKKAEEISKIRGKVPVVTRVTEEDICFYSVGTYGSPTSSPRFARTRPPPLVSLGLAKPDPRSSRGEIVLRKSEAFKPGDEAHWHEK